MRVLHLVPSVSPQRGGTTEEVFQVVKFLRREGVEAEIAATNDDAESVLELPLGQKN